MKNVRVDSSTEAGIQRRLSEGRGRGKLKDYLPWIRVGDFGSRGFTYRVDGWKTQRTHHFFSRLEYFFFLLMEWTDRVCDIREQFSLLPILETLTIAEKLGVRHPTHPKTDQPTVMTSDFLLTVDDSFGTHEVARAIKPSTELTSHRTLEKLAIEKEYWSVRGIHWSIATELEIDRVVAENIEWIHPHRRLEFFEELTPAVVARIKNAILPELLSGQRRLSEITAGCDDRLALASGLSLLTIRHLIATRQLIVDMTKPIRPGEPLAVVQTNQTYDTIAKLAA